MLRPIPKVCLNLCLGGAGACESSLCTQLGPINVSSCDCECVRALGNLDAGWAMAGERSHEEFMDNLENVCPLANVRRCFIRRSLTCPFNHQKVNHLVSSCQPSDEAGQETYVMNRSIRNLREHTGKKSRYWASTGSSSRWTSPTWTCRHLISANRNRQSTHTHTHTHARPQAPRQAHSHKQSHKSMHRYVHRSEVFQNTAVATDKQ